MSNENFTGECPTCGQRDHHVEHHTILDRMAALEDRFERLIRFTHRLSECVRIPYWKVEELQGLLNAVVKK